MKWKHELCWVNMTGKDIENSYIEIDLCRDDCDLRREYTWETCPHGKSQLVEEEDEV